MRFLKKKIAKASGLHLSTPSPELPKVSISPFKPVPNPRKPRESKPRDNLPSQYSPASKKQLSGDNIIKNYGRALTNFALSRIAQTY